MEKEIEAIVALQKVDVLRTISHMLSGIGDPAAMRVGERWQVNLDLCQFEVVTDHQCLFRGPCQVISTYNEKDHTWLWSSMNSSVPPEAKRVISEFVKTELKGLPAGKFQINQFGTALELATYIALKTGFDGAYPAFYSDNPWVFLAIRARDPKAPDKPLWCSLCGRLPREAKALFSVAPTFNICNICVDTFQAMLSESSAAPGFPALCVLCGEQKTCSIAFPYVHFCRDDLEYLIQMAGNQKKA